MNPDAARPVADRPGPAGLSGAEAAERLRRDGPNELPQDGRRGLLRIVLEAVREPMLQLLLVAAGLYLLLGDLTEGLVLLGFAVLNVLLVVVQENRTERTLAALRDLTSPRALVVRDGERRRIAGREVVTGDRLVLSEGDRVPADAVLLEASNLQADESLLTGESVPVRKAVGECRTEATPGGDGTPYVWSGTLVVSGTGTATVTATGPRTAIGKIGRSLGQVESAPTPLQMETRRLVRLFAAAGALASVLLALAYGVVHGAWLQAVLAGITLAMATLPQEFPVVLTLFLVLGAWRIAKFQVLARRSAAIEALGAATVLCTDKTGTLTLNRMSVARLRTNGAELDIGSQTPELPETFHELLEFAILASRRDPFDPMERAFHQLGQRFLANTEHLHADWLLEQGYSLEPNLLAMSQVWRAATGGQFIIAAKGAPEAVADLCHLSPQQTEAVQRGVAALSTKGLRVLAVAKGVHQGPGLPRIQHDFDFVFLGLLGLADPLRPGVTEAVAVCRSAGIRVAMITGDDPGTARAIARQAGIASTQVLTGQEMAVLDDTALRQRILETSVYARIMPEQKLRLVQAFAAAGEVVAMTGDGVNDAPSLKAAHIGVAMGGRGTDVAREAADLVLLDDDFTNLVAALRLGRRIDDNLRKAVSYILAVHVPIVGMSLIPVLLGWPLLLGPLHVVFLELIIDPVSSMVLEAEPESPGIMSRPPRDPRAPLFGIVLLSTGLLQGAVVLAAALATFMFGYHASQGEAVTRAMAFLVLVLGNLGLVLSSRSLGSVTWRTWLRPTRAVSLVMLATLAALALVVGIPWARPLFGFAPLSMGQVAASAAAALGTVLINSMLAAGLNRLRRRGEG